MVKRPVSSKLNTSSGLKFPSSIIFGTARLANSTPDVSAELLSPCAFRRSKPCLFLKFWSHPGEALNSPMPSNTARCFAFSIIIPSRTMRFCALTCSNDKNGQIQKLIQIRIQIAMKTTMTSGDAKKKNPILNRIRNLIPNWIQIQIRITMSTTMTSVETQIPDSESYSESDSESHSHCENKHHCKLTFSDSESDSE